MAPALETLIARLQLAEADDLIDALGEFLRERGVGDDILDTALRVGGDQADTERRR